MLLSIHEYCLKYQNWKDLIQLFTEKTPNNQGIKSFVELICFVWNILNQPVIKPIRKELVQTIPKGYSICRTKVFHAINVV